ncbi:methyl-accepting chemotaxis protein [Paucibacter sp. DJ2R-2]|uniref:methyl-accepting chemotaxis protein n=1 Tax=Paucibacter sp. DJ2R-2 TaxID=2893558 RepID=UPI0021E40E29|nr:methyl-accepting chemotaxis protein [Paucibacter sp. DJ2R-2]MCV2422452.1 methyl-accepting chemotaxis protein [Paucibacter sp. DJ4R-1]MCV2440396.1 methyl-accepting chemotaxis protein [Paucibacter sp. DJ2R-2]
MKTIKQMFSAATLVLAALVLLLLASVYELNAAGVALSKAQEARYVSSMLADELRQSSDDLTRLARTYVMSGDPVWEQQYFEVLDIRNGKKARPAGYEKIYWDFRAAGRDPASGAKGGTMEPLLQTMKKAGFTEAEFAKLKEAAGNSDDLVKTETIAMNLVKGLYEDGNGGYTKKGEPDLAKAQAMMHDKNYHQYKAKIMAPVDEFLRLLDGRTEAAVSEALQAESRWFKVVLGLMLALAGATLGLLWYAKHWVNQRLGAEPFEVVAAVQVIADGNLAQRLRNQSSDAQSVMGVLAQMVDKFADAVSQVRNGTDGVATASAEIAQGNNDLSARTEQQASNLQRTASSMDVLGSTVRQNADNARSANQLAVSASSVAIRGGDVVSQVVDTMKGINDSSRRIADIISVIDGIAFQTNILALNAAVEAARAGEQGRGFAVVASEVRSLAQRSAEAAKEIKQLINDSVERVERGTQLVDQAGSTMEEIVASIKRVTDIMGEISTASGEQSAGVAEIGQAVTLMDQSTQQNAALVEQSAAAAESLRQQANTLQQAVAVFTLR